MQLSSSWANPERAENLALQLSKKPVAASLAMQSNAPQRSWLVVQLQQMLNAGGMPDALNQATQKLPSEQRATAQQALQSFSAINAQQTLSNQQSAWLERFF